MLSSATLFHFTHDLETLKKILREGFKPFYSCEDLGMFDVAECPGIPMVSFCDIPLSQTQEHVDTYGYYALGFEKQWGMNKNISPVHYIYRDSICAHVIREVYRSLPRDAFNERCGCLTFNAQTAIFYYGKPYSGKVSRKDRQTKTVTFYNEREWRYVPFADQTIRRLEEIPKEVRAMLSQREYGDPEFLQTATTSLHQHYQLTFAAEDVKYLIVANAQEIPEIFDFIDGNVGKQCGTNELRNCSENDKKRLMARVMSMCQIKEDF